MKQNIYRAMAALFMVAGAAQAQTPNVLEITETGETFNSITVTYNGSPVAVTLTGAADNWTIQLPADFDLAPSLNLLAFVGEPESASELNEINVTQDTFLTWKSDLPVAGTPGGFNNPDIILDAGDVLGGTAPQPFNLVLADIPAVQAPEVSSTAALCGLALLGLCGVARFGRVRHDAV
jgi:hypothetical protein